MNDELTLPKPPEGYFWRIHRGVMNLVCLELREKTFWGFSKEVDSRFILPREASAKFIEDCARGLLHDREERLNAIVESHKWVGEYYR